MESSIKISLNNTYHVQLIGPDKKIKEDLVFNNTICKGILNSLRYNNRNNFKVAVGKGTGTPSWDDQDVFQRNGFSEPYITPIEEGELPNKQGYFAIGRVVFSPGREGDFSELGIYYSGLITHALFLNAEGKPIKIHKTDLDTLTITIRVEGYYDNSTVDPALITNKKNFISYWTKRMVNFHSDDFEDASFFLRGTPRGKRPNTFFNNRYPNLPSVIADPDNRRLLIKSKVRFLEPSNSFPSLPHYCSYINQVHISSYIGDINFPNETIFPRIGYPNTPIGVGDGEKKLFNCPYGYYIEGTQQVSVDGEILQEGKDYSISSFDNTHIGGFSTPDQTLLDSDGNEITDFSVERHRNNYITIMKKLEPVNMIIYGGSVDSRYPFEVYASTDGKDYTLLEDAPHENMIHMSFDGEYYTQVHLSKIYTGYKYWKIAHDNWSSKYFYFQFVGTDGGRVITFKNPPAKGKEIKFTAMTDLIPASRDYAVDFEAQVSVYFDNLEK